MRYSLILIFALAAMAIAAEPAAGSAPAKASYYLITDYLPPAIYDGDDVTACFRIENTTGAAAKLDFVQSGFDDQDKPLNEKIDPVEAPSSGFGAVQRSRTSTNCRRLGYVLRKGTETIHSVSVRLLRCNDPWPAKTIIRDGRLEDAESHEVLIPAVQKRLRVEDRAFAPLKWIAPAPDSNKARAENISMFVPGRWQLNESNIKRELIQIPAHKLNAAPPILCAVDEIIKRLPGSPVPGPTKASAGVVIWLPPEDLDLATDPRVYRTLIEVLLARLELNAMKPIVLVPPFQFGANEKHTQALWREVNEAAASYHASTVDATEYLNERLWRVDPNEAGVYGLRPNAMGLQRIEQALDEF